MTEDKVAAKDVRIPNVSLHSRGKTENGTLLLTRHHLIFSYHPGGSKDDVPGTATLSPQSSDSWKLSNNAGAANGSTTANTTHSQSDRSTTSTAVPQETLNESGDRNEPKSRDTAEGTATPKRTRARPKEIWLPYPMVNHCTLRSHPQQQQQQQRQSSRPGELERVEPTHFGTDVGFHDNAFPPSYGTSLYTRPSTDSTHVPAHLAPSRSQSPATIVSVNHTGDNARAPAIRIRRRDFQMMAFHFNGSPADQNIDEVAREVFFVLRSRCCVESVENMHAFTFKPPQEEVDAGYQIYDARREFERMGIGGKAAEGPGSAWRLSEINRGYSFSPTYPSVLCVPRTVSDNMLKYGGAFRSRARIPVLTYLHSNGGSVTRSSQPMVGIQNRRNPQDERLVSAIFSSHTPFSRGLEESEIDVATMASRSSATIAPQEREDHAPNSSAGLPGSVSDTAIDEESCEQPLPEKKIYGSTRRTIIVDARPRINALANRASGGGIEDTSNYVGSNGAPVEKCFLDIANIHVMRASLEKVVDSFGNSDYLDLRPNQDLLRKSAWLSHISNLLAGAEDVARAVGLGASHVLIHCSDGWDRTAQVAAVAQIMMDPYYRTLNGFITLVQKDFLSFGHKFNHRHGIQGSEKWFEIENERIAPSKSRESGAQEPNSFNTFGSKALSGARNWFEKGRGSLFRQPGQEGADNSTTTSPVLPANPIMHSAPSASAKEEKEHKVDVKEIAPIFQQFLEAVFQLQHQEPDAFEYNERFLRRLLYQAYSSQYGEFLFNTERERLKHQHETHSVWAHFLSRRQEFINPTYASKAVDPLLFPQRNSLTNQVEVCWWSALFGRKDDDMNTPFSLGPQETIATSRISMQSADLSGVDDRYAHPDTFSSETRSSLNGHADAQGLSNLSSWRHTLPTASSNLHPAPSDHPCDERETATDPLKIPLRPANPPIEIHTEPVSKPPYTVTPPSLQKMQRESTASTLVEEMDERKRDLFGLPKASSEVSTKLDFAEFARQSAFNER